MSTNKNQESVPSKTGIKRPTKVMSTESGKAQEEIQQVLVYLRGEGFGPQLNEENEKPVADVDFSAIPEAVAPGSPPEQPDDADGAMAWGVYERRLAAWNGRVATFDKVTDLNRKARREFDRQNEARERWQTGHDKAVGLLGTFVEAHKFKQVISNQKFKDEPTLYTAVELLKEMFTTADKSG
jgi:hypothetical protein